MFSYKETVHKHKNEYLNEINNVLESGVGMNGNKVKELEQKLSEYTGSKYSICCSNGTLALTMALNTLNITKDDEVITTPFSWISSSSTIVHCGAKPIFCDIKENNFNIDVNKIESLITPKTKCILIVNIFGNMLDEEDIERLLQIKTNHKLFIIEDSAQSFGAQSENKKYRSCSCKFSDISCTSFYPTKPLAGFGDGGCCFTNNEDYAEKLQLLRNHGMKHYGNPIHLGYNGRMNEFQAGIILVNFKYFDQKTKTRLDIAKLYNEKLSNKDIVKPKLFDGHMCAQYCLLVKNRDKFIFYLKDKSIPHKIFYEKSLAQMEILNTGGGLYQDNLPITNKIISQIISIPCYDTLKKEEVERYIEIINKFLN